ncbi:hypothetical protein V3C99_013807 [Haemonchus contortus]|uniref:Glycine-rich cell wall structural protein-like n=1 Tax=Haemonchus contortus TaxID=6289 RepID=A0A7I4YT73_HAECO|nr:unnamed protein product [Haemonchus contortus]
MNKLVLIISAASICIVSSQWGPGGGFGGPGGMGGGFGGPGDIGGPGPVIDGGIGFGGPGGFGDPGGFGGGFGGPGGMGWIRRRRDTQASVDTAFELGRYALQNIFR